MTTCSPSDPTRFARTFELAEDVAGGPSLGTVVFVQNGLFLHADIRRADGSEWAGLAAVFGGRLVIAFGPRDKVEIGAYRLDGDRLEGLWVPPAAKGTDLGICGREWSRRVSDGTWQIEQAHSIDGSAYHGMLTVTPRETGNAATRSADFLWKLQDGEYRSFGLVMPDAMFSTFCLEPESAHGIAVYETTNLGLRGTLVESVSRKPRLEWMRTMD